jgi:long-chain acyl-CoA synthetase
VGTVLPALRTVVVAEAPTEGGPDEDALAAAPALPGPRIVGLSAWLAAGEASLAPASAPGADDLAAIVYTSGTTGKPKGVMLTHRNVVANVQAILRSIEVNADDLFLSFLPLSHTFERTAGYYLPMAAGACVAFARSIPQLAEDLRQVRPTVLVSVPRIYERVHAALQSRLAAAPVKARLFAWTEAVGWRRFCRAQRLPLASVWPAWVDALAWPVLDALVARQLRAQFGGRLRAAVSGGAPLSAPLAHCFLGLGIPLLQGYGMTETSPVVSVNLPQDNDPLTVGRPLPGVEVRIGPDRELQVRGPSVMKGYLNRPEDTARTVSADGWLGTGDQAAIENGRVRILGRIKEIIVTSTGEKVPPADLELAIMADPLFAQVMVLGEQRPFIAAIVVLGEAEWRRLAGAQGLSPDDPASLQADAVREAVLARIRKAAASFPHYAVPRAVCLSREAWTVENTMLTPTLKLKRQNLMQHFEAEITRMYKR